MDDSSNRYNILDEEMIERATIVVVGIVGSTAPLEANRPFSASYLNDLATV